MFVFLSDGVQTADRSLMKISPNMYLSTRKVPLNFGSNPRVNHENLNCRIAPVVYAAVWSYSYLMTSLSFIQ